MKKRLLNLFYFGTTLILLFVVIFGFGHLLRPVDLDIATEAVDTFHALPKNSVDVLCLGSSHMWRGLDPLTMYREYGITAYNYGCVYQKINTTLLFLQDAFLTQSPKIVVIDSFYANRLNTYNKLNNELYSTRHIRFTKEKLSYLHSVLGSDPEQYLAYFVPFAAFHGNWESLFQPDNDNTVRPSKRLSDTLGFAFSESTVPASFPIIFSAEQLPLNSDAIAVLDEIVSLCNEHQAHVVFITIPYEKEYQYVNAMRSYASANKCIYLNLFEHLEEIGYNGMTDFSDGSHLNASGAAKTASFLGAYLSDHFELTDHRSGNQPSRR